MAKIFLAIFLLIFGLNMLIGLAIPVWITGILALVTGILLLAERLNPRIDKP
jgi:hypothetical protein